MKKMTKVPMKGKATPMKKRMARPMPPPQQAPQMMPPNPGAPQGPPPMKKGGTVKKVAKKAKKY